MSTYEQRQNDLLLTSDYNIASHTIHVKFVNFLHDYITDSVNDLLRFAAYWP